MIIAEDTKWRFVEMLMNGQIIVIESNSRGKYYNYKYIGANSNGKWDFTPMMVEVTGYPNNGNKCVMRLAVRSTDGIEAIVVALLKLEEQGVPGIQESNYAALYYQVRDLVTMVYI